MEPMNKFREIFVFINIKEAAQSIRSLSLNVPS
jgi:hypothetical protein